MQNEVGSQGNHLKETKRLKIGINGLGRIGRAILRINIERNLFDVVVINDVNHDNGNLAYMLKYDSTYGKLIISIHGTERGIELEEKEIPVHHNSMINEVPWHQYGVDLVIDSSGVSRNVALAHELKEKNIKCVITHSPGKDAVDKHVIMGVNEDELTSEHQVIASSICDSTAFAPVMKVLNENYGVENGSLTTLHPWLAYQNLVCGPSRSFSFPGTIYRKYALGRSSIGTLIPKQPSCIPATEKIIPFLEGRFMSHSFRVPTSIVSCANFTVKLRDRTTKDEVIALFKRKAGEQKVDVFYNNFEPLVSSDYAKSPFSANIDHEFTEVKDGNQLKMVVFYDNEWGYSSRVVDLVLYFGSL